MYSSYNPNSSLKRYLKNAGLNQAQVASELGVAVETFDRMLSKKMTEEQKQHIRSVIDGMQEHGQ